LNFNFIFFLAAKGMNVVQIGCCRAIGKVMTLSKIKQYDYNLAAWRFGERLAPEDREKVRDALQLRGLADAADFLNQVVDWELSIDPEF
jgi:hypothetical protein